jgi:hypothetical protein
VFCSDACDPRIKILFVLSGKQPCASTVREPSILVAGPVVQSPPAGR